MNDTKEYTEIKDERSIFFNLRKKLCSLKHFHNTSTFLKLSVHQLKSSTFFKWTIRFRGERVSIKKNARLSAMMRASAAPSERGFFHLRSKLLRLVKFFRCRGRLGMGALEVEKADKKATVGQGEGTCHLRIWHFPQFFKNLFDEMSPSANLLYPIILHVDNSAALSLSTTLVTNKRTKHIDIRFHFLRELHSRGIILPTKIHTDLNKADLLTKPADETMFLRHRCHFVYDC